MTKKKAKKKAPSKGKKPVGPNDYVSTYKVFEVVSYNLYSTKREGEQTIVTNRFCLGGDREEALKEAYELAKTERESRGLEQGDMRVIFPDGIIKG